MLRTESVRFTTYDGVEIAADLYLPNMQTEWVPGIIVCHGFASSKERHAEFGKQASGAGFATLIMDLRGHGESGGQVDANIFNDVAAALLYLQNRAEVSPMRIAIRGSSMGGWLAIHTASHLPDLAPVVAYCPTNELGMVSLMEEVAMVQRGLTSPFVPKVPPRVDVESTRELLFRLDITKATRRLGSRPLLLVHCEKDEAVPVHVSQRIYDAAKEPKTLWLLPDCNHQFAQHDPDTNTRVLDWIKAANEKAGGRSGVLRT